MTATRGPMTGGMGVVSPTSVMSDLEAARAVREVLEPTARGLCAEGRPFRGLLYAGLMLTDARAAHARVQLPLRQSGDAGADGAARRRSRRAALRQRDRPADRARALLAARRGLRGHGVGRLSRARTRAACPSTGSTTPRASRASPCSTPARAGTAIACVTAGGRVLGVTGVGDDVDEARARAYRAVEAIHFEGAHWRRDIGTRRRT